MTVQGPEASQFNPFNLLARPEVHRFLGATLAVMTLGSLPNAAAQTPNTAEPLKLPAATPLVSECAVDLLAGHDIDCNPVGIPLACLSPDALQQAQHFDVQKSAVKTARRLVRQEAANTTVPNLVPHLTGMFEDDKASVYNNQQRDEGIQLAGHGTGAQVERFIIRYDRYTDGEFRSKNYDRAIRQAKACGFDVQLTLACNNVAWKESKFGKFVSSVALHYRKLVSGISPCNEPNLEQTSLKDRLHGWLKRMPGKTLECTYASLYGVAQPAIKAVNQRYGTRIKTILGELSSLQYPIRFLRRMLNCDSKLTKGGKALPADEVALHYYDEKGSEHSNSTHPYSAAPPKPTDKVLGLSNGGLPVMYKEEGRLFKIGKIATTTGERPIINLSEGGDMVRAKGPMKDHNVSELIAAKKLLMVEKFSCLHRFVGIVNTAYQIDTTPKSARQTGDFWDTSKANRKGHLDVSYFIPMAFRNSKFAGCFTSSPTGTSINTSAGNITQLPTPARP